MKTRRESHKSLVFEQRMEKRNIRTARAYGYREEARQRQILTANHNYIVSLHHKYIHF